MIRELLLECDHLEDIMVFALACSTPRWWAGLGYQAITSVSYRAVVTHSLKSWCNTRLHEAHISQDIHGWRPHHQ